MHRLLACLTALALLSGTLFTGAAGIAPGKVLGATTEATGEPRVALVIGNSAYEAVSPLDNPKNDATLMATTLRDLGFTVIEERDADIRAMARAIRDFGKALRKAGPTAVGLFFYAGHGVQARGTNYLIPLDAEIETEADLDIEAVSASSVLSQMEGAGNALNLVILDACRNNPFKGAFRSGSRGLVRMDAPSGSMLAFAAAPGQVAADGNGQNSPYTAALTTAMREPGLSVEQVFKRARIEVEDATGSNQTPWEESSLKGDFYFVAPPGGQLTVNAPATDRETVFWQSISASNDPALYQAYLAQFPDGSYSPIARIKLQQLTGLGQGATQGQATTAAVQTSTPTTLATTQPQTQTQTAVLPPATGSPATGTGGFAGDWHGVMTSGFKAAVTVTGDKGSGILKRFNHRGDVSFTIAPDGKVTGRVLFGNWNAANATLKGSFPNIYVESGALEVRGKLDLTRD
jgi:hypothetical protein